MTHRKQHVLLILVDSARVRHGVRVLDHRHRLSCEEEETGESRRTRETCGGQGAAWDAPPQWKGLRGRQSTPRTCSGLSHSVSEDEDALSIRRVLTGFDEQPSTGSVAKNGEDTGLKKKLKP